MLFGIDVIPWFGDVIEPEGYKESAAGSNDP
jgi:hypothetical protein